MKKAWCVLVLVVAPMVAAPAWSAEYMGMAALSPTETLECSTPAAGASLLAALSNLAYVPLRFTITAITAEVGGLTGWMTGGDEGAAYAVWQSTDGQAYIRPEVLEGRERLRFGRGQ